MGCYARPHLSTPLHTGRFFSSRDRTNAAAGDASALDPQSAARADTASATLFSTGMDKVDP